jgi:uncharacterized membrane protein
LDHGHDPWTEEAGDVERLAFFSDAVFAIAMTLLVVDLERPQIPEDASARALRDALLDHWPDVTSYVVSFLVIGNYWAGHHRLLRWFARADRGLVWRNLLVLLGVAFVPYPTSVLSDYAPNPTAVVFYAATLAIVGAIWWETWLRCAKAVACARTRSPLGDLYLGLAAGAAAGLSRLDRSRPGRTPRRLDACLGADPAV